MLTVKTLIVGLLFLLIASLVPRVVYARQGCCSYHGGVCGCGCCDGTGLSATCAPYYPGCGDPPPPPLPVADCAGSTMSWTLAINAENSCNRDVSFSWTPCKDTNRYSVALNQYAGADPGPNADTTNANFTFKNVKPGKLFFNLKPGNAYGWGRIWYWSDLEIVRAPSQVELEIDSENKFLKYRTQCIKALIIEPKLGEINDMRSGIFGISTDSATIYKAIGMDPSGNKIVKEISFTPTVPQSSSTQTTNPSQDTSWWLLGPLGLAGYFIYRKLKTPKQP